MNFLLFPIQFFICQLLVKLVTFLLKAAVKAIVYSPQLFTAYLLCKTYLKREAPVQVWLSYILLVAFLIYQFIFLLKYVMHQLMYRSNWFWLPLFLLLVAYTCIFPVWISFDTIHQLMRFISLEQATFLTWLCSGAMSSYIYSQYHFLKK